MGAVSVLGSNFPFANDLSDDYDTDRNRETAGDWRKLHSKCRRIWESHKIKAADQ